MGKTLATAIAVLAVGHVALADYDWNGSVGDGLYTNTANWTGTATDNNFIDNGDTVVVDADVPWVANDLKIATKGSATVATTGRVDIVSGSLSANYWTFVGDWIGNGTLNIADTSTGGGTYTGYGQGTGSYTSGALDGNGNIHVGLFNSTGVLNMNTTGSLDATGIYVSPNGAGGSGTFNLDSGTVNLSSTLVVGSDFWGAGAAAADFNMSGGEVNVDGVTRISHKNATTGGDSQMTVSGGTLNSEGDLNVGYAGDNTATATMTISDGGVVNVASTATRWLTLTYWDAMDGTLNVENGGTLNLNAGTDIMFAPGNNSGTRVMTVDNGTVQGTVGGGSYIDLNRAASGGTSTMNIQNGGLVAVDAIVGGDNTTLNFDNGTLKATASDANFIGGDITAVNIMSGGAILDTDGNNPTVAAALLDGDALGGGVTKNGDGTLTMLGANTYTGDTDVNAGGLLIDGSVAGNVNVASGASVGGTGSVAGDLDLASGALLSVSVSGLSVSTLTVDGSLTLDSTFGLDDLDVDWGALQVGTYSLVDTVGDFSGIENFGVGNKATVIGDREAYFQNGSLQLVVIPEPATIGMIGMFGAGMLFIRRRLMM